MGIGKDGANLLDWIVFYTFGVGKIYTHQIFGLCNTLFGVTMLWSTR